MEMGYYEDFKGSDVFLFSDAKELESAAADLAKWSACPTLRALTVNAAKKSSTWTICLVPVPKENESSRFLLLDRRLRIAVWLLSGTVAEKYSQQILQLLQSEKPGHILLDVERDSIDVMASVREYA
jgi:hypothetical protein